LPYSNLELRHTEGAASPKARSPLLRCPSTSPDNIIEFSRTLSLRITPCAKWERPRDRSYNSFTGAPVLVA